MKRRVVDALSLEREVITHVFDRRRRTKMNITVNPVEKGYIVTAGCMTLTFSTKEEIITEFIRWINDPYTVEKEYIGKYRSSDQVIDERIPRYGAEKIPEQGYKGILSDLNKITQKCET